jgi:hypothetical protein
MKRREFISLLGGAAAWPLAARAQQPMLPVIGLLSTRSPAVDTPLIALIRQGLAGSGFVEGQNIAFDYLDPNRASPFAFSCGSYPTLSSGSVAAIASNAWA